MSRFTRVARSRVSGQQDVGHESVITGRDAFSLRSSIANPQGVAQPSLQSTTSHWHVTLLFKNETTITTDLKRHCYKFIPFDYGCNMKQKSSSFNTTNKTP